MFHFFAVLSAVFFPSSFWRFSEGRLSNVPYLLLAPTSKYVYLAGMFPWLGILAATEWRATLGVVLSELAVESRSQL